MSYRAELIKLYAALKPFILKALPFVLVFSLGLQVGQESEARRIVEDCKYAKAFRAWTTAYNCQKII